MTAPTLANLDLARTILQRFQGRPDYVAYQPSGGTFTPHPLKCPLTPEKLADAHLGGKTCLGFYLMRTDDTVMCSCVDLDNHDGENPNVASDTKKVCDKLDELGFDDSYLVEKSQSGTGFHIWLFNSEPLSSALVRRFWKQIIQDTGIRGVEIYPKQDSLKNTPKSLGNLVRYPFWNQSQIITPTEGETERWPWYTPQTTWAEILTYVSSVSERELENVIEWYEETPETVVSESGLPAVVDTLIRQHPDSLLARRWQGDRSGLADRSLSAIALSIAHELVRAYVPPDDIDVTLEFWGRSEGYQKALRADWRRVTVRKSYDIVAGRFQRNNVTSGGTFSAIAKNYADMVLRGEDPCLRTGIDALDESIGGVALGELCVISARPSHGKTALSLQILDYMASKGHPGLYISLEMSAAMTAKRLLSRLGDDVPYTEWDTEEGNEKLKNRVEEYFGSRAPLFFVEDCSHINQITEAIETHVTEHNVRVVVVDYQGRAQGSTGREYEDQSEIVSKLKTLAKAHNIVVFDLVQMKREIDLNPEREPCQSDLRASGVIENDADVILFARYPMMWDKLRPREEYVLYAEKCRNRGFKQKCMHITFESDLQTFK